MKSHVWLVLIAMGCAKGSDTGSDLAMAESETSPYVGGWPFNPDKDGLGNPLWEPVGTVGSQVPRFVGVDQYGDEVDLYDFAGHGVPIVLDLGTIYCAPCQSIAAYLSDGDSSHLMWDREGDGEYDYYPWWKPEYEGLRQMVLDQEVFWITVLFNDSASGPSDHDECATWHEQFPNERVPVLADTNLELKTWLGIESYPTLNLVNSDMVLDIHSTGGPFDVFRYLGERM